MKNKAADKTAPLRPWSEMQAEIASLKTSIAEAEKNLLTLRQRLAFVHNSEFPADQPKNLVADLRAAGLTTAEAIEKLAAPVDS